MIRSPRLAERVSRTATEPCAVAHEAGDREHDHRGQVAARERRQRPLEHARSQHEQRRRDQRAQAGQGQRAQLGQAELR
jgi:hypothetical protein